MRWGGWGSNPRPADYEKHGPALRVRYLHGYHGVVPPIALIALLARVARSTNRSTLYHGDHRMPTTKRYRPPGRSTRTRWRKAARGEPNAGREQNARSRHNGTGYDSARLNGDARPARAAYGATAFTGRRRPERGVIVLMSAIFAKVSHDPISPVRSCCHRSCAWWPATQQQGAHLSPGPGMSRYQNSGSEPAAGTRAPRRGGREGAPTWSAAWTAAATSCAVSGSTAMFRRSSTRRTTCPTCGGTGAGLVTPGTVEETPPAGLMDTPALRHLLRQPSGGVGLVRAAVDDHVENRSILNTTRLTPHQVRRILPCLEDLRQDLPSRKAVDPSGFRPDRRNRSASRPGRPAPRQFRAAY